MSEKLCQSCKGAPVRTPRSKFCQSCNDRKTQEYHAEYRKLKTLMDEKTCGSCGETKPASEFGPTLSTCRVCIRNAMRARRAARTQEEVEFHRKLNRENAKLKRAENPEKFREYDRLKHAKRTPEQKRSKVERSVTLERERRHRDPNAKMSKTMRSRLKTALRRSGVRAKGKTVDLIGCTAPELKVYLEKLFLPGMTWENHGLMGWHIDHIKPCKDFDLSKEEEQRECFHYTNLRPLWWRDNLARNRKYGND